ncbi:tail fiber domain-containing protein [Caballeronia sp. AZ7_KS35]|uniref:tail fiber domain-containing protein n=1 Tax=Caballeronia sp. AZ7_KS35 TaxID=2921762 RepID=UPI002027F752|nr:tail fiber domain-containing protein [Caballeronia sp. AZ7_KS35]
MRNNHRMAGKIEALQRVALMASLILLATPQARAAEPVPGSSCTGITANSFINAGGPENGGVSNLMFCNGGSNLWTGVINFQSSGRVGIGNTGPGALLDIGMAGTTLGTLRLEGNTSGYVGIQSQAAAGSWTMSLPISAGTSGYVLSTDGAGVTSWISNAGTASTALSGITAAAVGHTIANANFAQVWNWDTLTSGIALKIGSTSMTTGSLLSLTNTNAAASTGSVLTVNNSSTGAAFGITSTIAGTANGAASIKGIANGTSGVTYGVYGSNASASGYPGYFTSNASAFAPQLAVANTDTGTNSYAQIGYIGGHTWSTGVGTANETDFNLANKFFIFDATGGGTRLVIDSNGWVGIGTAVPEDMLTVYDGDGIVSFGNTPGLDGDMTYDGGADGIYYFSNDGISGGGTEFHWTDGATSYTNLAIHNNGNVLFAASAYLNFGATEGTAGYGFRDSGGTLQRKNSGGSWATISTTSDQRLKRDIVPLPKGDGLASIMKLRPVRFHWKDVEQDQTDGEQIGLIAQEVEKVYPSGDIAYNFGNVTMNLGNGKKETIEHARGLNYEKLVPPLIKALQEQQAEIQAQEAAIKELKEEIAAIKRGPTKH